MSDTNSDSENYKQDTRTPCKYGEKCYQKNSEHHSKFKHPPKKSKRKNKPIMNQPKKAKLSNEGNRPQQDKAKDDNKKEEPVTSESAIDEKRKECISSSDSEGNDDFLDKQESAIDEKRKECISSSNSEGNDDFLDKQESAIDKKSKECISSSDSEVNENSLDVQESHDKTEIEKKHIKGTNLKQSELVNQISDDKSTVVNISQEAKNTEKNTMNEGNNVNNERKSENADEEKKSLPKLNEPFDAKKFIKTKFLVEMPNDFFEFWEFCKQLKPTNPCDALKDVNLKLVGPYDVLAEKFKYVKKSPEEYLQHWRYYYDIPEVFTVIKGDDKTGYHVGYFYDSPNALPSFLVSNYGTKDGVFTKMGDNIFAAISLYLEELKKNADPFKKVHVVKLLLKIKTHAEKLNLSLSSHTKQMKERHFKVVAKTFNKIGLVVPYNKKTQLGYRELAMPDNELMTLLTKLQKAAPEQTPKYLSDLQPVLTYANIALDECDFGTGVKLGWELLYHGIESLNSTISQFLANSYRLLDKEAFAKIIEAHMNNRRKGCNLSII